MARKSHRARQTHRRRRTQRGGGGGDGSFAINTLNPIHTASGAPLESRAPVSHCGWDNGRVAPAINPTMMSQFGGRRKSRRMRKRQRGGACDGGCGVPAVALSQRGGGSGNGGFGFQLDNSLGKVYSSLSVGPCPPAPVENILPQRGGAAVNDIGIVSYKTGFGYNDTSPVTTSSAHYLNQIPYDRTCGQTGGRRRRRSHRR